jgi:hypothetical protein
MVASYAGEREYGGKERWVKYWARLGCWISQCYGPFSLGGRYETHEQCIFLCRGCKTSNSAFGHFGSKVNGYVTPTGFPHLSPSAINEPWTT